MSRTQLVASDSIYLWFVIVSNTTGTAHLKILVHHKWEKNGADTTSCVRLILSMICDCIKHNRDGPLQDSRPSLDLTSWRGQQMPTALETVNLEKSVMNFLLTSCHNVAEPHLTYSSCRKTHCSEVSILNQIHEQRPDFPIWTQFHCYIILAKVVVSNAHNTNRHLATCHMCLQFSVKNFIACLSIRSDELLYFSNCL